MTNILFDVVDVLGEAEPGDSVVVWPPHVVATDDGKVKNTRPQTIRVDDGPVTVDLDPGPLWVQLQCGDRADTDPKLVRIPDLDEFDFVVTLRFLLDKVFVYDKVLESWAYENAERAEQAALDAIAARDRSISEADLSKDAAAVSVAAALGFEGHSPEQVIDAAARAESARDTAVDAASTTTVDRTYVGGVRSEIEQVYNASEAGQAIPPRLTESGLGKVFVRQDDRSVHVRYFGAIGDGIADDTDAVEMAIRSGFPIYWGDHNDRYRITKTVIRYRTDTGPIVWNSDGASIICDPISPIRRAVFIQTGGEKVSITGPLTIDANRLSFAGFSLDNTSPSYIDDALISELTVKNVHRSSTDHIGGDGVLIRGGFNRLTLDQLTIRNVTMAAGVYDSAGDPEAGISGLTVVAFSPDRAPRYVHISGLVVDGVYDEDPSHHNSQNGVRLYGPPAEDGRLIPFPQTFSIVGGSIRNCGGRSVKVQRQWGSISGLRVYRDIPRVLGKAEIDFQRSGGRVTDLYVQYDGASSGEVVKFGAPPSGEVVVPHGSVDGLRVVISGKQVPDTVITSNQYTGNDWRLTVRDVETIGTQPPHILTINGGSGGKSSAIISDIYSAPTGGLIRATGGSPKKWSGTVAVSNCVNTGSNEVPVFVSTSGGTQPIHRTNNISGFVSSGDAGDRAVINTVNATTSGWNNLKLVSGFGDIYSPSYYRPPAGTYRVTYIRSDDSGFDRVIRDPDRNQESRMTVPLKSGAFSETLQFTGISYLRVAGIMSDVAIVLEKIF